MTAMTTLPSDMSDPTVGWKRLRPAHDLGEAVSKRLRGAHKSLLAAVVDRDGFSAKTGDSPVTAWPGSLRRLLSLRAASAPAASPFPASLGQGAEPDTVANALLQPLPPPSGRSEIPIPPAGPLLWTTSFKRTASIYKDRKFLEPRTRYMGYAEYASWVSAAVPETELRPSPLESLETELTGLELLRLLGKLKAPKKGVPQITPEEKQLAEDALFGQGSAEEVVASRFSVEVTRRQIECLRPGEWLNDEVINFYYKLLQERSKVGEGTPKCWFPNSFFWPKLSGKNNKDYSYKEVRRWTVKAKIDIFELDYVIFPMNIGETHWAMGAIDLKDKGFRYFDSMFSKPPANFVAFLRRYVADEHKAKKNKEISGVEDWDLLVPAKVPQQKNGYDCGVFTCFFADCFSAGKSLSFEQEDMPTLRMRIAARILKADEKFDPIP